MINNLQNIASVGGSQGGATKAAQAVAVQFPNLSRQNQSLQTNLASQRRRCV